jgi:two-component system sensor histidine kinase KdpD
MNATALPLYQNKLKNQLIISVLIVGLTAALGFFLEHLVGGYRVVAFMLLVSVSVLAMFFDIIPVLIAAGLSALVWDFFFIEPRFTFSVGTGEDRLLFLMYFVIALVNAVLTYKIRQVEKESRKREEKAKTVQFYNTLLNSLSHELRTPIAAIIGASDNLMVNNSKLTDDNRKELVSEISTASVRLNQQVENLLSMSRLESGIIKPKKDWCDIDELIHSAINKLENKPNDHEILIYVAVNLPLFQLDFVLMEQVIQNLVTNAINYTPPKSTITISAKHETIIQGHFNEENGNTVERDSTESKLVLTVYDTGKGFPEDEIDKVFDKFYRLKNTKAGGTGLGLSIVKGFVEEHGGTIKLENMSYGGAKFIIEIPSKTSYLNALKNE